MVFVLADNLVDALHKNKMLNFVLVSLISSDSIFCKEDAEKSLDSLKKIEEDLNSSGLHSRTKKKYQEKIDKCYDILYEEIKRFEEDNE